MYMETQIYRGFSIILHQPICDLNLSDFDDYPNASMANTDRADGR